MKRIQQPHVSCPTCGHSHWLKTLLACDRPLEIAYRLAAGGRGFPVVDRARITGPRESDTQRFRLLNEEELLAVALPIRQRCARTAGLIARVMRESGMTDETIAEMAEGGER